MIVGYFSEWSIYQRKFSINKIDGNKITNLHYAFCFPHPSQKDLDKAKLRFPPKPYNENELKEGAIRPHDGYAFEKNMRELREWKKRYPHVKVMLSLAGWTLSFNMSKIFKYRSLRDNFLDSIGKHLEIFDGLDFDWEYPVFKVNNNYVDDNDNRNFYNTLKEVKERYPECLLSIAMGCGKEKIIHYDRLGELVDYACLMTYDFSGNWDGDKISHHSPYSFMEESVIRCIKMGYKKNQLVVGIPFYWRHLGDSLSENGDNEVGLTSWKYIRALPYDSKEGELILDNKIYYGDTPERILVKCDYVKTNKLGGVMCWELSDDYNGELLDLLNYKKQLENIPEDEEKTDEIIIKKVRGEIGNTGYQFRGVGEARYDGEIITLSGNQPRIYGTEYFKNVEAQVDYKRIGKDGANWGGGIIGVRSHPEGHSSEYDKAHTYYFRVRHDGGLDFYRELEHAGKNNVVIQSKKNVNIDTYDWINIMFRCYNLEDNKIKLEGYVNRELVLEYTDENKKMFDAEGICFIRNTDIEEAQYKNFIANELYIDSISETPTTEIIFNDKLEIQITNTGNENIVIKSGEKLTFVLK